MRPRSAMGLRALFLVAAVLAFSVDAFRLPQRQGRGSGARGPRRALRMAAGKGQDLASDFCLTVLGDLHLDRKDMELHEEGRQHVIDRMAEIGATLSPTAQVRYDASIQSGLKWIE